MGHSRIVINRDDPCFQRVPQEERMGLSICPARGNLLSAHRFQRTLGQ